MFTHFAKRTKADIFLLSEIGSPSPADCREWTEEAKRFGLDAIFYADTQAAILWRPSPIFTDKPRAVRAFTSSLDYKNRSVDAVFQVCGKDLKTSVGISQGT